MGILRYFWVFGGLDLDAADEGVVANILDATDEKATGLPLEVKKQHREKENINWPGIRDASIL